MTYYTVQLFGYQKLSQSAEAVCEKNKYTLAASIWKKRVSSSQVLLIKHTLLIDH